MLPYSCRSEDCFETHVRFHSKLTLGRQNLLSYSRQLVAPKQRLIRIVMISLFRRALWV